MIVCITVYVLAEAWARLSRVGFKISWVPKGIGGSAFAKYEAIIGHDHPRIVDMGANIE